MISLRMVLLASALLSVGMAWEFIRGENLSRNQGQAECQARFGQDLATVETLAEVQQFAAITQAWDVLEHVWIGAKKDFPGTSTSLHWQDGSAIANTFWRTGEPNTADHMCIHIWITVSAAEASAGQVWNDATCDDHKWAVACGDAAFQAAPACTVPESEWLETAFEPVLSVAESGFTTGASDMFRFAFDYHRKYYDRVFNTGADNALETEAVTEHSKKTDPSDPDYACWDSIELDIAWGDLVPFCHRDDASDPAFVLYTCKVTATGLEDLDPIRSVDLTRLVHHELPVIVQFPKQVTASYAGLSAFQPPNVLAAIVRQEVNVDVSNLDVAATVRLYTSVQYPFRLVNPVWDSASGAAFPTGIQAGVAPSMFTDCTPFPEGGDSPGQPGDEFACNQVWNLDLDVIGGANPSQSVCSLDGTYLFAWQAECLSTFPSDCPLVPDDLGQIQNKFAISFTLDSEYFCPQVVDTVDVAATMAPYKDIAHAVAATNFILGQTLYLVADVTSSKVTVAAAQLDDLSYDNGAGAVAVITDKAATGNALSALAWFNSGESPAGTSLTVPANQVWIQFLVSDPPFAPPVDGSQDFSVSVVLDVQFKDASVALLQVAGSKTGSRQLGAKAASSVSDGNDDGETAAGHKMQKKLAFTVSTVAAAGAALNFA